MEKKREYTSTQAAAALGIGFVCLVIGVPLWWKTTQVYRVTLPYDQIETLADNSLEVAVNIEIVKIGKKFSTQQVNVLESQLMSGTKNSKVATQYNINVRSAITLEEEIYKKSSSLSEFNDAWYASHSNEINKYHIICFPTDTHMKQSYPYIGKRRLAVVKEAPVISKVAGKIELILRDVIVQEKFLEKKFASLNEIKAQKPDKESMRSVKSSLGYDVTFSLVVHEPHMVDVKWDIQQLIQDYIEPLTNQIPVKINIKSQMLAYTNLFIKPIRSAHHSYVKQTDLPHMINPLESKLGSHVSNFPSIEFILYVPPAEDTPLYIHDDKGVPVSSNSFLSPQWGGIIIYNIDSSVGGQKPIKITVDGKRIMPVFLTHLRLLTGIHFDQSQIGSNVNFADSYSHGIHDWELDAFMRSRCIENLVTASVTVKSLANLLAKIHNIVINDDIGREVQKAVESIQSSYSSLKQGKLDEAFTLSLNAINASEKAFFDPSLLELLYFPEDQKFAIYIPLFLPISIPVVMSVVQAIKWIKSQRKLNDEHFKSD